MSINKNWRCEMEISEIAGFVVDYSPDQLKFENYRLPNFIVDENGNEMVEAEELLGWIIDYSRRAKTWLAIEHRQVNDYVQKAYSDYECKAKMLASNKRRMGIFRKIKFLYYLKVILTLGFYGKNNPAPEIRLHTDIPMMDAGKVKLFEKSLGDFHQAFKDSYAYLRNNGYLHAKTENYILYLYPSEMVIEKLRRYILPESFNTKK